MVEDRFKSDLSDNELNKYVELLGDDREEEFHQANIFKKPASANKKIVVQNPKAVPTTHGKMYINLSSVGKRISPNAIKRKYVSDGRYEDLFEPLTEDDKKYIISKLTEDFYNKAENAKERLTSLVEKELRRYIKPHTLMQYLSKKSAFTPNEGFVFECSAAYDHAKLFIKPDIPKIFIVPNEMQVLRAKSYRAMETYEKLVDSYYHFTKARMMLEVKLALVLEPMNTIINLIDHDTNWYNILSERQ